MQGISTAQKFSYFAVYGLVTHGMTCDVFFCVFYQRLDDDGIVFSTRVTDDENAITNSLEIYQDPR